MDQMDTFTRVVLGIISVIISLGVLKLKSWLYILVGVIDSGFAAVNEFLGKPLLLLYNAIRNGLNTLTEPVTNKLPLSRLSDRAPVLGSGGTMRFVLLSMVYLVVTVWIAIANADADALSVYFTSLFFNTAFGYILSLFVESVSFDPVNLISAGFTCFLSYAFFHCSIKADTQHDDSFIARVVQFLYHIPLMGAACLISLQLADLWQLLANWVVALWESLVQVVESTEANAPSLLQGLGAVLALLPLCYLGLMLLLVAIREFIVNLGYGIVVGMVGFSIIFVVLTIFPNFFTDTPFGGMLFSVGFIAFLLISDYIRVNPPKQKKSLWR